MHQTNLELSDVQIKAANRLLLRADAFCLNDTSCPFHSQGKGSVVNVYLVLAFTPLSMLTSQILQAFNTVLTRALSGTYPGTSADDIRVVMSLAYLSLTPNFPVLNQALAMALNGDLTPFTYDTPTFTQNYASVLPIACLDAREPFSTSANQLLCSTFLTTTVRT